MRSNKDIRYSPKIDDIVYLIKDVKTHIGKKMMIPQNTPCKVTWHNFDSVTLLVLAGLIYG